MKTKEEIREELKELEEQKEKQIKVILINKNISLIDKMSIFIQSNNLLPIYNYIKENNINITKDLLCYWIIILCQLKKEEEIKKIDIRPFYEITSYEGYTAFQEELQKVVKNYGTGVEDFLFFLINEENPFYKKYDNKGQLQLSYYDSLFYQLKKINPLQVEELVQNEMVMKKVESLYSSMEEENKTSLFSMSNPLMNRIGAAEEKYQYLLKYYKPCFLEFGAIKTLIKYEVSKEYIYSEEYIQDYDEITYDMDYFTCLPDEHLKLLVYYGRGMHGNANRDREEQLKRFLRMHLIMDDKELDKIGTLWFSKGTNKETGKFLLRILKEKKTTDFLCQYDKLSSIIKNILEKTEMEKLKSYKDYVNAETLLLLEKYPSLSNDIITRNTLTEIELLDIFILLTKEEIPRIPLKIEDVHASAKYAAYLFKESKENAEISPVGGSEILFQYNRELVLIEEDGHIEEIDSGASHLKKFQDIGKKRYGIDLDELNISGYDKALYLAFYKKAIIVSIEGKMVIIYTPYDFNKVQLTSLFAFLDKYDGDKLIGEYKCAIVKGFSENKKPIRASLKQGMFITLTELNKELHDFAENRDLEKKNPTLS